MDPSVKLHTKGRYVCGRNAEVEGDLFRFKGIGGAVGVVKITEPMSPMFNYYEYEIVDKGVSTAIGVGVGEHKYPLDRMPGWNRCGIGYHADDGRLFHENGYGRAFGPLCTTGDRMGCGVHFDPDLETGFVYIFFTKNGKQIGDPVKMKRPHHGLYPLIGLHSQGEKVRYLGHWRRVPDHIQEPMETEYSPSTYWLRSNGIRYTEDSLTLEYDAEGLDRQDVGIAQANFRITPMNHYFELEILDTGQNGWIAIGLAKSTYPLTKHPGWCEGSVGYHADNGQLYKEKGQGEPFGTVCTVGDIMGCGVRFPVSCSPSLTPKISHTHIDEADSDEEASFDPNFAYEEGDYDYYDDEDDYDDDFMFGRYLRRQEIEPKIMRQKSKTKSTTTNEIQKCTVYFTKNGELVGETECSLPKGGFYPLVAMLSKGERIRVDLYPLSG